MYHIFLPYIFSTDISSYLCVIDAKQFLNDPHSDKDAIMSSAVMPYGKTIYADYTRYEYKLANIYRKLIRSFQISKKSVNFRLPKSLFPTLSLKYSQISRSNERILNG